MSDKDLTRLVKPYAKGQITIPAEFRERLGIDKDTILQLGLKGSTIEISPLRVVDDSHLMRDYDASEIEAFLEADKIDKKTATKARRILGA